MNSQYDCVTIDAPYIRYCPVRYFVLFCEPFNLRVSD